MASVLEFEPRRISVEEYHRMTDAGILDEDERVELLEGVIIPMSPQRPEPAGRIQRLANRLTRRLPPIYDVRVQLPLSLGGISEPEPDLTVVRADQGDPISAHPSTALLVIEVARESLRNGRAARLSIDPRAPDRRRRDLRRLTDATELSLSPLGTYAVIDLPVIKTH